MPPGRSRSSLSSIRLSQPMPMIIEGIADTPRPHVPPKSPRRLSVDPPSVSTSNRSSLRSPTPLAAVPGGPKSEATPEALQNDKTHPISQHPGIYGPPLTLRKGWYRTIIACFLLVGLIIGLSVGLTIGLRKRSSKSKSPDSADQDKLFPAGSYTFTTALTNLSASCSSSPSSWRCFPYSLYSPSEPEAESQATYHWTIAPLTSSTYTISSSTPNPFAPAFTNVTMALVDGNQYAERFQFSVPFPKAVSAEVEVEGGKKVVATCWYNSTVLSATIWTKVRASYPASITGAEVPTSGTTAGGGNGTAAWARWPFAVVVTEETKNGDKGECKDSTGAIVVPLSRNGTSGGDEIPQGRGEEDCGCWYKNFDLDAGTVNGTETKKAQTVVRRRRGRRKNGRLG